MGMGQFVFTMIGGERKPDNALAILVNCITSPNIFFEIPIYAYCYFFLLYRVNKTVDRGMLPPPPPPPTPEEPKGVKMIQNVATMAGLAISMHFQKF